MKKLISLGLFALIASGIVMFNSPVNGKSEPGPTWQQARGQGKALSVEEAKKLTSPVPYTKKSISQGLNLYRAHCTACHGLDGKATIDVVADATNLTDPKLWRSGTTEGEVFRSVREGAGEAMPPFKYQIKQDEDMWHLTNYIRSLWPESLRPKLQE